MHVASHRRALLLLPRPQLRPFERRRTVARWSTIARGDPNSRCGYAVLCSAWMVKAQLEAVARDDQSICLWLCAAVQLYRTPEFSLARVPVLPGSARSARAHRGTSCSLDHKLSTLPRNRTHDDSCLPIPESDSIILTFLPCIYI